jgi:polyhydroxybutyrate depolymerase
MRTLILLLALAGCSPQDTAKKGSTNGLGGGSDGGEDLGMVVATDLASGPLLPRFDLAGTMFDLANLVTSDGGLVEARPYHFYVPPGYDKNTPTPLVIMLHGYTANGDEQELYWNLTATAKEKTFLYAYPDGTVDPGGNRFWNATDACCNFYNNPVDDVAYVNAIIDDVELKYNVDPKRIYVTGHSNGGFMSHRMACDAPRVAAIVSLAGAQWQDQTKCTPSGPVSVLEIHGTADAVIAYNGGNILGHQFPSAMQTVADWAKDNGCTSTLTDTGMTLDLESVLPGAETTVSAYSGCKNGGAVELWSIQGGSHVPSLQPIWGDTLYGFLAAHPKP